MRDAIWAIILVAACAVSYDVGYARGVKAGNREMLKLMRPTVIRAYPFVAPEKIDKQLESIIEKLQ